MTINEDEHGLFEVFAQIGRGGGYTASFTEAVARLTSLCLRSGISVEDVVKQLDRTRDRSRGRDASENAAQVRSPKIAYDHREKVYSVPDGLAKALKRQRSGELAKSIQPRLDSVLGGKTTTSTITKSKVETDTEAEKDFISDDETSAALIVARGDNPECPDCGTMLTLQEGCIKCQSCGYSEC